MNESALEESVDEKREHPRTDINTRVSCERQDGEAIEGLARDISLGGMFVESEVSLTFGTKLLIRCQLAGESSAMALPAIVRWTRSDGFGVQFGLVGARETHAITNLLRQRH